MNCELSLIQESVTKEIDFGLDDGMLNERMNELIGQSKCGGWKNE